MVVIWNVSMRTILIRITCTGKRKLFLVLSLLLVSSLGFSTFLPQSDAQPQRDSASLPHPLSSPPAPDRAVLAYQQARAAILKSGFFTGPLPNR